jgi:3-deoxy-D-manno-octulosonate 8-phosphate phosphatase (KDO 8-P phosphatase)
MNTSQKIVFVMDIDGVLTDGSFLYDINGKAYKKFGPDDADALKLIKNDVVIKFVSADHRGFEISRKRIEDMGYVLDFVKAKDRATWIQKNFPKNEWVQIYMGDSFVDIPVLKSVDIGIVPNNANNLAKDFATYVSPYNGGDRAVADAVFYILEFVLKQCIDLILTQL